MHRLATLAVALAALLFIPCPSAARAAVVAALRSGSAVTIPTDELDVTRARLAYRILRSGRSYSASVVPWTRAADGRERGVSMVAVLVGSGARDEPVGAGFGVRQLNGQIPDGASRVVIRLRDGRRVSPRFSYAGTWWTWFAVDRLRDPGSHPVELLALDARGRAVARHDLGPCCGGVCR